MAQIHRKIHKHLGWAVIASELSHVFCCVIPTLVTVLSAFANVGLMVMAPDGWLMTIHEALHHYEIGIIVFSGVMVALGWIAHLASRGMDCHESGCHHPPCDAQKSRNSKILLIATCLFAANLVVYFGVHRNVLHLDAFRPQPMGYERTDHDAHHHDEP